MYKALRDAYVVLCGYNANPAWKSFASEQAERQIDAILNAVPEAAQPQPQPAQPLAQQLQQAVAREREECAAICEDTVWTEDIDWWITATKRDVSSRSMLACAAAIRAKGTHD